MTATIIPFRRPDVWDELDDARLYLADEVATYAIRRATEIFGDQGNSLDVEATVALVLAAQIIDCEREPEGGAA